jgi:hypothetical protein
MENAVYTIRFFNNRMNDEYPTVWVCENRMAYLTALANLCRIPHIKVVESGPSHVVREDSNTDLTLLIGKR